MAARSTHNVPMSLAHLKVTAALDRESQVFWRTVCAFAYAERWWDSVGRAQWPPSLRGHPGDGASPFRRVPVPPGQYISESENVLEAVRENTIVAFIAAFETYLSEVVTRALYIDPAMMPGSDMQLPVTEVARGIKQSNPRAWFARGVAAQYVWNKPHHKVIEHLNSMLKLGLRMPNPEIEMWRRWQLVRNSIVHCGRTTSTHLSTAWSDRFSQPHVRLSLNNADVTVVSQLARSLGESNRPTVRFRGRRRRGRGSPGQGDFRAMGNIG